VYVDRLCLYVEKVRQVHGLVTVHPGLGGSHPEQQPGRLAARLLADDPDIKPRNFGDVMSTGNYSFTDSPFFSSVAYVWVRGANTTWPILKKFGFS
jgi:hypothetical protein